jgi:hypothetical protein
VKEESVGPELSTFDRQAAQIVDFENELERDKALSRTLNQPLASRGITKPGAAAVAASSRPMTSPCAWVAARIAWSWGCKPEPQKIPAATNRFCK